MAIQIEIKRDLLKPDYLAFMAWLFENFDLVKPAAPSGLSIAKENILRARMHFERERSEVVAVALKLYFPDDQTDAALWVKMKWG